MRSPLIAGLERQVRQKQRQNCNSIRGLGACVVTTVEAEASSLLKGLALPAIPGEPVKAAMRRASWRSGLSYWRVYRLWHKTTTVRAEELEALRRKAAADAAQQEEDHAAARRREIREVLERLERIEAFMARMDSRMEG
jgi:hypothetical protein